MNITERKLINKICAILVIMTLTISDFLLIGKSAVSYAIDKVATNNSNVDFSAYFQKENAEKVQNVEDNIDKEDEYLYVDVSVKNEGYFNGSIKIADNNFNIKSEKLSPEIAEISDNVVKLNQINAGSTVTLKLGIEARKEDKINENILNTKTKVELNGQYTNSKNVEKNKPIEIKGTVEVGVNWKSSENANARLAGKLLTNSIYEVNGENKRLVQILVNSKLSDNNYPVKTSEISLNVPDKVEKVVVSARNTKATNSSIDFSEKNYNVENGKLTIKLANEDKENISWEKNARDEFVVTYILNKDHNITNQDIQIQSTLKTYDEKEKTANVNVHIEEVVEGLISCSIEGIDEGIYKGKIYTGEEKEYTVTNKVNIDYIDDSNEITIEQKESTYMQNDVEKTANIIYKSSKISKDEFTKIFGENGAIVVKNQAGQTIANINKDTQADENGNIVINYANGEKYVQLVTSKPVSVGTLNIENTKGILNAGYARGDLNNLTGIKEKITTNKKVSEKVITLKETETSANIALNVSKLSTIADKQNITLEATLQSNDESKDLYKNPNITIKLPKEITVLSMQSSVLYKNGLELAKQISASKNENGETEVNIKLNGEQKNYDVSGGTKIRLQLAVKVDKLTPSKSSQIEMNYTNENKGVNKKATADINFESQYGLMIYNQIANYNNSGDAVVTVDKETAYGELNSNSEKKDITLNTALINNYGEKITNVTLVGKIPSKQSDESFLANLSKLQTNNDKIKVYYSDKSEIKAEDTSWGEYTEKAVSYKVVVDEMEKEEIVKLNVPITIPENIKYGQKGTLSSTVSAEYENKVNTNSSNIVLATKTDMSSEPTERVTTQETKTGLSTKISAFVGNDGLSNNDNVYEGQTIRYKVTLTNNTGKDYKNVTVKAKQKNGTMWDLVEKEGYNPYTNEKTKEHFYEVSDKSEITLGTIESLKNGEEYTYEYETSVYELSNEKIDGTQTYGTITTISEDKSLNETVDTIKNNIKSAELEVNVLHGSSNEMQIPYGGAIKAKLDIKNKTNETLKDVEVKVAFSSNLESDIRDNERITLEDEKKNDDGTTYATLKISYIGANEIFEIELYPSVKEGKNDKDNVWILAQVITPSKNSYISNKFGREVYNFSNGYKITQQAMHEDGTQVNTALNNGDKVQFEANITNNDQEEHEVELEYILDEMISVDNAKITTASGEKDVSSQMEYNNFKEEKQTIKPGETVKLDVVGTVDTTGIDGLTNKVKVFDNSNGKVSIDELSVVVNKPNVDYDDVDDNTNNSNNSGNTDNSNNSGNSNNAGNNSNNNSSQADEEQKYTISGIAWLDDDKNGRRSSSEEVKGDIDVYAMNSETGEIVATTKTSSDGTYQLELKKGKYIVIFKFDDTVYTTTIYQESGANSTENSDAIEKDVTINGASMKAGATDVIELNQNLSNIDIGLITRSSFNLKAQKYVSKITVQNSAKTVTYDQKDNTTLAKAEIKAKNLSGSLVVIEYKIKVTNAGDVAGYARNVVDYMPATLSFNSSLNSDWYLSGNNLYNTSLSNTRIEPGETKELTLVLTKTMTDSNTGLINNKAEIIESSNELGIKNESEDKGSANVIISVSTGALVNYVTTTVITLIVLAGLAYLVNKKFLSKKI